MSAPEVDWVLNQLADVVTSVANDYSLQSGDDVVVKRVDRDDSQVYDGSETVDMSTPLYKRTEELEKAVYVGASYADRSTEALGTGYDHDIEAVVNLRLEGLIYREWGHVDPAGENGVPFEELKRRCRDVFTENRKYPSLTTPDGSYHTLEITNEDLQSSNWADFYRYEFDILLRGEQDL